MRSLHFYSPMATDLAFETSRWRRIVCSLFLVAVVIAAVGPVTSSRANQGLAKTRNALPPTTITVINTNDSGPGSLRQALFDANAGDTINFDSSLKGQKITLTSGQLNVNKDLIISGPGANNLTVDGNAQSRVFYVNQTVTLSGLTIRNGYVANDSGGGIYNDDATLTITNCTLDGNSADYGGGILNSGGIFGDGAALTVSNCTISGNYGGGIYNQAFGADPAPARATLTITNSILSGNYGGGIGNSAFNGVAGVVVTNCTISGNYGTGISNGSAGANGGGYSTATVSNCTLSGNSATGDGAGIYNVGGTGGHSIVTVSNSTLSGNSAASDGGGVCNVGEFRGGAALAVTNTTLSGNSADHGGGIFNGTVYGGATLAIGDTILSVGNSGENIYNDTNGTVTSLGYNLSSDDGSGYLTGAGDQINTDPMLGPLQNNGGPTYTHALLPGSSAIKAGDPNFTPPPNYDQRGPGFDRVMNGRIDIGSFEVQGPTPTPCQTWVDGAPLPYNAGGVFAVSDGTFVYAGGGADLANNIFHKDLLKYDPMTESWTPLAPSLDFHYHSQAVYFDGKIYNMGGYNENLEAADTTRIYEIATNTWTTGAPMPHPLAQMATMLWNGIIYVAGGNDSAGRVNTLYAYDVDSNTWTTLAPMPQPLTLPGFGAIGGKLYIAGGSGDAGYSNTLYVYDIATDSWSTGENLLQVIARPGSAVLDDGTGSKLYLYGGRLPDLTPTNITQIYDPDTDSWSPGPNMNVALFSSYGTAVGNVSIVAPGGLDGDFVGLNNNEQLINIECATPTPTPTVTPTSTPTATPTATPTPTTTATPSATPRATPRPRPTPHPRPTQR